MYLYLVSTNPMSVIERLLTIIPAKSVHDVATRVNSDRYYEQHQREKYGVDNYKTRSQGFRVGEIRLHSYRRRQGRNVGIIHVFVVEAAGLSSTQDIESVWRLWKEREMTEVRLELTFCKAAGPTFHPC